MQITLQGVLEKKERNIRQINNLKTYFFLYLDAPVIFSPNCIKLFANEFAKLTQNLLESCTTNLNASMHIFE